MNSTEAKPERLLCLIVSRNLGDCVIQSGFLKELASRNYAARYLVWTRPQVSFLFSDIPNCEVVTSQFPVGTSKQFGGAEIFRFLRAAWQIRMRRPSTTLDLVGDFRERIFARLAGSRRHLYIGWESGHPFGRIIRNPVGAGKPLLRVPLTARSVYSGYRLILNALVPIDTSQTLDVKTIPGTNHPPARFRVGLHPFASQRCKLWPDERWRELAHGLIETPGVTVVAFGAPADEPRLRALFKDFGERIALVTGNVANFANETATLDVMVGLDSFAVHMAQRQNVRSVMINAGNDPGLWAPPGGLVLSGSGGCRRYPCLNVPDCEGTTREYACVRSISVQQVRDAVDV